MPALSEMADPSVHATLRSKFIIDIVTADERAGAATPA